MSLNFRLKELVESNLNDVIAAHGLKLLEVSENEVVLKSATYALDIIADRDGASIVYFDTSARPVRGYNVFLYLFKARRDALIFASKKTDASTYAEFIDGELASLSQHLRRAGQDILGGSKNWISGYSGGTVEPGPNIASII
jgi:hypothetical protein